MPIDSSLLSPYPAWDSCDLLFESCDKLGIGRARWGRVFRPDYQSAGVLASRGPISQMVLNYTSATFAQGAFPVLRLDNAGGSNRASIPSGYYPEMTGNMSALIIVTPQRRASTKDVVAVGVWGASLAQWGIGLNYSVNPTDYKPWFALKISGSIYLVEDPTAWNIGDRLVLLAVREGDRMKLWKNGNLVAYGTCPSTATTVTAASLRLGEYNSDTTFNTQADYEAMVLWENAIPDPQAAEISRNPYILWEGDDIDVGTTLVPTPVTETLSSSHILVVKRRGSNVYVVSGLGLTTTDVTELNASYQSLDDFSTDLVGWWRLDDNSGSNAADSAGVNTGTLNGSPSWVSGRLNYALQFSGSNSVSIASAFSQPTTMTVMCWFKGTGTGQVIIGQTNNTTPPTGASAYIPTLAVNTSGKLRGEIWTGNIGDITSVASVNDGLWHHAAITCSVNTQSLYLDGQLVDSRSGTIDHSWWEKTWIGTSYDSRADLTDSGGQWLYYVGKIDDVRIYNAALSGATILAYYNAVSKVDPELNWSTTGCALQSPYTANTYNIGT